MRVIGKCEECLHVKVCLFKDAFKDNIGIVNVISPPENVEIDVRCKYYHQHQTVRA